MDPRLPKSGAGFSPADFPALREFLRGYFHEDWLDEHGSVGAAVRQFRQDADDEQQQKVTEQWQKFRRQTGNLPLEAVRERLISLGSGWYPVSNDELETFTRVLTE